MYDINQIADYVIFRVKSDDGGSLINLKLQKLLYYIQAWTLAFHGNKMFEGKFQAWVHGPVNREIYDRFKDVKYLYSSITLDDIRDKDVTNNIKDTDKNIIESILESYAGFSGTELELMTHREDPWIQARTGYSPMQRCEVEIDEVLMENFYKARL